MIIKLYLAGTKEVSHRLARILWSYVIDVPYNEYLLNVRYLISGVNPAETFWGAGKLYRKFGARC